MKLQNELADELDKQEIIDKDKVYDERCKKILSNKQILSHIIKECVSEYKNIDVKEIPSHFKEAPKNMNIEDVSVSGAKILYDVLTELDVPNKPKDESIGIIVNVEAQNKDNPGYSLVSRGFYYCSRLISRQKADEKNWNYGKIKKVYSIWICLTCNKSKSNTMNSYKICESKILGDYICPKEEYDLMEVVMLYPNAEYDSKKKDMMEMLNLLFKSQLSSNEKKMYLESNYDIIMTEELMEEVDEMCNFSKYHEEVGQAKGRAEGRAEERLATTILNLQALISSMNCSLEQAMTLLKIDETLRPAILKYFNNETKEEATI